MACPEVAEEAAGVAAAVAACPVRRWMPAAAVPEAADSPAVTSAAALVEAAVAAVWTCHRPRQASL